ncbi:MAG: hypothetical protein DDT19_01737 [Syntrophomonadaceae bacterium]|nr:hypothetical protein [Bacillota bacterium]
MVQNTSTPGFKNAVVREDAVDQSLSPQDSVEFALNVHFDSIGAITRREGLTRLGAQQASVILGMGVYRNNAGSTYAALAKSGTAVFANTGSGWTSVRTGLTVTSRARFTNLVDHTFMVNGNANQVCSTWGGAGSFGSTNVASLPVGDFIENYRNRIWVANNSNDRISYSDVVTTSGTITGGTAFIQISPADGQRIRGLFRHPRALLVFKENNIYRVYNPNSSDPDPSIFRGTYSQESIIQAKDGIYYHHPTGFYKFVWEGEQEEISLPISDIVKAIPRSSYENIAGWADDNHVLWSIGNITLDGISFTNLVVRRTISTKVWTVYSYPTQIRSTTLYDSGSTLVPLLGDSSGNVLQFDTGNDDFGTTIHYDVITHWITFTSLQSLQKNLSQVVALHENAEGTQLAFQVDMDNARKTTNAWRPMGQISQALTQVLPVDAQNFYRIRFRIFGNSSGTPFKFRSLDFLSLSISTTKK